MVNQSSPPDSSSSGTVNLYTKSSDKKLYHIDETGMETGPLGVGGGGANPSGKPKPSWKRVAKGGGWPRRAAKRVVTFAIDAAITSAALCDHFR